MTLPAVDFCGLKVTRLILGANPFGGYSHQNEARDKVMREYHTVARILETWERAEAAGINTMITNNETPHVLEAVRAYKNNGGILQWITQVNALNLPDIPTAVDESVAIGCSALFFHGMQVDELFRRRDAATLRDWCAHARSHGIPVGVAGHDPETHLWVNELNIVDFHVVCFFNCGSLHNNEGDRFVLRDIAPATACIRSIQKPCIAYKIMGAGRIDPYMAFEHAFANIKPSDVVNVGMHRGDNDNMIEENVAMVREILNGAASH